MPSSALRGADCRQRTAQNRAEQNARYIQFHKDEPLPFENALKGLFKVSVFSIADGRRVFHLVHTCVRWAYIASRSR